MGSGSLPSAVGVFLFMTDLKVDCIVKSDRMNPYERIKAIGGMYGGKRWQFPEDQAIKYIESGQYSFHTFVRGLRAQVIVAMHLGRNILRL